MTDKKSASHIKILVFTKSVDGYPPEEWEGIWARPLGNDLYQIDNIPFYAKGLSCDDIVEVEVQGAEYRLARVVKESDNSTIRVLVYDLDDEQETRARFAAAGCSIEGVGTPGLLALSVPKESRFAVDRLLKRLTEEDKIDYEEGALR